MLLVVGRKDIEPEWGEALGHLCTQRIEMAVRRVIGMYSLFRVRVSEISSSSGVSRAFFKMSCTGSTAACIPPMGLACHLYRVRPWSLDRHTR
jgi:hypothetical protein